jgi:hypothetical protein
MIERKNEKSFSPFTTAASRDILFRQNYYRENVTEKSPLPFIDMQKRRKRHALHHCTRRQKSQQ